MSFGLVAAGIGAAGSIAGGMMQGSAAEQAAGTSAQQSMANAAAFNAAGKRADKLYTGSAGQADSLLRGGYQGARQDMRPYDRLGQQGSNRLARYLGFVPEYGKAKPTLASFVKPVAGPKGTPPEAARTSAFYRGRGENESTAQSKAAADKARYQKELAAYKKPPAITPKASAADKRKHANALAKWEAGKAEYTQKQKGKGDYGDYNRAYTRKDLMRDPVYQTELNENVRAWDQSAASRGSLMSGNTVAGLRELTASGIQRGYDRDWNQRDRKYNALAGLNNMGLGVRTGLANAGMQAGQNRANLASQLGANRANSLFDFTRGATGYAGDAANTRAEGQLTQGTAYANAFNDVGYLGMKYGQGAFGGGNNKPSTPLAPRPSMQPLPGGNQFDGYGWFK